LNVKIAGAHGGISVGPDGATHQALEEITLMSILPNMQVSVPCDAVESQRATIHSLLEINGPVYIRFAREATPVVTTAETPFVFGRANVIRYRGAKANFREAFETVVAGDYANENESATIVACGPMVAEAMRAAWMLREEYGIEVRVLNVHTVKPLDVAALVAAAEQTGAIVTAEEHQVGGFGNIVAGAMLRFRPNHDKPLLLDMIGVRDRFGVSGRPWELVQAFGLAAEHIAERVVRLVERRQAGCAASQMVAAVECAQCHGLTPVEKYLAEGPLPSDELCAECDRRAPGNCAVCRSAWLVSNANFAYVCGGCRAAN
jgi:transketolase